MNKMYLSKLLGYLLGDASFKMKKRRSDNKTQSEVAIECADKAIVEDFSEICKKLLKREVGGIHSRKRAGNWRRTYHFTCKINKEWRNILLDLSPTYRTKPFRVNGEVIFPELRIPRFISSKTIFIANFLKAFTNCEGSIQLRVTKHAKWFEITRYVKLSCSHPHILQEVSRMLEILGISNRKAPKNNPVSVIIQGKKSILEFNRLIGFKKGIEVSNNGRWAGYEKRDILNALLKTFSLPRGKLQEFKKTEEIYNFIKINYLPKMDSETRIQALRGAAGAKISQCTQV
jgi:hypothetical protein